MSLTVERIAAWVGGEVIGDSTRRVEKAQSVSKAGDRSIAFFVGDRNSPVLKATTAAAVLIAPDLRDTVSCQGPTWIVVGDPKQAFLEVAARLHPRRERENLGISSQAFVSSTAAIGQETNIHSGAFVGEGAVIGNRCDIFPGAVVSRGCKVGDDVVLYPNAVLYEGVIVGNRVVLHAGAVIGADGFGYRTVDGRHERIPHFGTVRIEDDVDIGANTTIDRAMVDETVIGQGTKLDNLVMIGHNCELGRHNLFASQVGLAGSVTTGDYVVCAGQVGIADHVRLGAQSVLGAKAGVHKDVPPGQRQIGIPAIPEAECRRVVMAQHKLPEMRQQLKALLRQVEELSARLAESRSPEKETGREAA